MDAATGRRGKHRDRRCTCIRDRCRGWDLLGSGHESHSHLDSYCQSNSYFHSQLDTGSDADTNCDAHASACAHANANANDCAHANANAHAHALTKSDSNSNSNANANANANAKSHSDCDAYTVACAYSGIHEVSAGLRRPEL